MGRRTKHARVTLLVNTSKLRGDFVLLKPPQTYDKSRFYQRKTAAGTTKKMGLLEVIFF